MKARYLYTGGKSRIVPDKTLENESRTINNFYISHQNGEILHGTRKSTEIMNFSKAGFKSPTTVCAKGFVFA